MNTQTQNTQQPKNNIIPFICIGMLVIVAPIIQQPKTVVDKNMKQGVINSEFVLNVTNMTTSNSGFISCSMNIKELDREVIGPCSTTSGLKLIVGHTYLVQRAKIEDTNISVNEAKDMGSGTKWRVKETYVRARTPLMTITDDNGNERIVGNNDGLPVGSYVNVD